MSMTKYGTFVMYQNTETDEVIEVALADEEGIKKYAEDSKWREVGSEVDSNPTSDISTAPKEEF